MTYKWPMLKEHAWMGARLLAIGAAFLLFVLGDLPQAHATITATTSVGLSCYTSGSCQINYYSGDFFGECMSTRPCYCQAGGHVVRSIDCSSI